MNFTRDPIIETVITPREGCKLVVRSSKGMGQEEYFVEAIEVVSFGQSIFYRSLERPKSFLVPVGDYEVVEVKETRMVLKNVSIDKSIKIGGGKTEEDKEQKKRRSSKNRKDKKAKAKEREKQQPAEKSKELPPQGARRLIPPPPVLIKEKLSHIKKPEEVEKTLMEEENLSIDTTAPIEPFIEEETPSQEEKPPQDEEQKNT